jgi:hypothetical protein
MLFFETAFLLLYSCKQHVLLWQQQIFRTSNPVCSKQQSVLIISYKQLEFVNYKLKISSLSTLMLIEQYIFLLSHSKIYSGITRSAIYILYTTQLFRVTVLLPGWVI